jgi:hypothetical protein
MASGSCTKRIAFKGMAPAVVERDDGPSVALRFLPNLLIPVLPLDVPDVVMSLIGASAPTSPSTFFLVKSPISQS